MRLGKIPFRSRDSTTEKERAEARTEEDWTRYAKDLCYRQLGMMERSVFQLRQALERNLVPEAIIVHTLDAFKVSGLVDDARFAAMFVRSKFAEKTISRRGLTQELLRRGIAPDIIADALEQIDTEDEQHAAVEFALRKAHSMRLLEPDVIRRRLYSALARRGFSADHIRYAVEQALSSIQDK